MSIRRQKKTLADKIGDILSSAPITIDPEDDITVETSAIVTRDVERQEEDDDDFQDVAAVGEEDEELLSTFRKRTAQLLEDTDVKYKGQRITRKHLNSASSSNDDDDKDMEDLMDEALDDSQEDVDDDNLEDVDDESQEDDEDVSDFDGGSINLDDKEVEDSLEEGQATNLAEESGKELSKGLSVKNQLKIWENLLEVRIQLQKCLTSSNRMPQGDSYRSITETNPKEFQKKLNETSNNLKRSIDKMLDLQEFLIKRHPETKNLYVDRTTKPEITSDDEDNEEIPSDLDEESKETRISRKQEEETNENESKRKRRKYETSLADFHTKYTRYRNDVIRKWYDKTRMASLKTTTSNYTILDQIEYNLNDRERLVKKSQLKRMQYDILGKNLKDRTSVDQSNDLSKLAEEYDREIYDDNDFYHQLLRELIEVKSSDLTDPIQLSKQWIQLQNLRSKMKRKVDTRATKGRKVRYTIHNKLVNYMAPVDEQRWHEDAKIELFNSLFGKSVPRVR